jgi:hypothetical protein
MQLSDRPQRPEVVARLVEWPTSSAASSALIDTAAFRPPTPVRAGRTLQVGSMPLPPGGVRPIGDDTRALVDWATPSLEAGDAVTPDAVLTTGQLRVEEGPAIAALEPAQGADPIAADQQHAAVADPVPSVKAQSSAAADSDVVTEEPSATGVEAPRRPEAGAFYDLPAGDRTVYLIDASGSLLDTLPFAVEELYRAVRTLHPSQQYAVVFFNGDGLVEAEPIGMQPATLDHLTQTLTWLEPRLGHVRAKGRPDAAAALGHALSMDPDTVILLSDGITGLRDPAGDRRKLVTLLGRLGRGVRLHSVQFIDPDPLAARGRLGTLELLASLTDGKHRFVSLKDVQRRGRSR